MNAGFQPIKTKIGFVWTDGRKVYNKKPNTASAIKLSKIFDAGQIIFAKNIK
jgi:hypothetical protein